MHLCFSFLATPQLFSSFPALFPLCVPTSSFLLLFSCLWSTSSLLEPLPSLLCYFLLMYLGDLLLFLLSASSLSPSWMCSSPHWLFWGALKDFFQLLRSQWLHPEFTGIHFYPVVVSLFISSWVLYFPNTVMQQSAFPHLTEFPNFTVGCLLAFLLPWSFRAGCSHIFNSWCASTSCDSYPLVRSISGD